MKAPWKMGLQEFFGFLFLFIVDVVVGVNAFNLDFISSTGTVVPYTGMWYLGPVFWAGGMLCAGLALVAVLATWRDFKFRRGY